MNNLKMKAIMTTNNTIKNFAMRFVAIMAIVLMAGNVLGATYTLVTDASTLSDGDKILIVTEGRQVTSKISSVNYTATYSDQAMNTTASNNHLLSGDVSISSSSITSTTATEFTLSGNSSAWKIHSGNSYLYTSERNKISTNTEENGLTFTIAIDPTTHAATIQTTKNDFALNSTDTGPLMLKFHATSTNQSLPSIYFALYAASMTTEVYEVYIYKYTPPTYAVTYNNGGHGTAPSGATASSVQLSALTATGYTCTGWKANVATKVGDDNVAANTLIANGSTVTILAATTFTAQWRANAYAVAFNANGGSGSTMTNQAFTYNEAAKALSANTYTAPADKYFYGWHRTKAQADLGNREYADKAEVQNLSSTDGATVTLYAAWKDYGYANYRTTCVNTFYVTYVATDKTSGSVPTDENEYSKNATVTVLGGGDLAKIHYAFAGWTDGDNDYEEDDEFTITKDVELTARWTCDEAVTIAKAASTDHGSFALSTSGELATCNDDIVVNVTSISPETGYEFSAITIDGVGTKDDNAKTVTYDQYASGTSTINVTFAPKTITVTWDANEGSVTPASSEYIYDGSTVTLPTPERTGYVFDGWFTLAEGGDEITEIGITNKPAANVTYHAHWHKANYAIKWSVAGDDTYSTGVTDENNNADYEGTVNAPTAPADGLLSACQTDGKFVGWTASDAVYSNHPITSTSDIAALGIFTNTSPAVTGLTTFRAVYAIETTPAEENYMLQEEFDNSIESDATTAISTTTFANFNGETTKAFKGAGGSLKLGSSNDPGKITSKTLDLSENFKVRLKAKAYYGTSLDAATLYVKVGDDIQSVSTSSQTNALTGEYKTFVFDFDGTTETTIEIGTSAKRAYIDDVDVYTLTPAVYTNYMTECCPQRTITIADLDAAVGTISADVSSVCEGEQVTLSKTENHYNFTGWKVYKSDDENTTVDVDNNNQFDMPNYNVKVEATWTPKNYEATITAPNPADGSVLAEGGSIEQGHRYVAYGSTLTVTAEAADDDHYFQNWTVSPAIDGLNTSNNPMTITMPGNNITVTANFGEVAYPALTLGTSDKYTLTAKLANGDDIPNMGEIRSGTALMVTYELSGQQEFVEWKMNDGAFTTFGTEGNVATFNMPDVDLNIDIDVLAYYTLNLSAEHGTISAVKINNEPQTVAASYHVHAGEEIEVTAVPEDNTYKFKQWNKTGNTAAYDGSSATATLTVGTENMMLEAVFEDKVSYNLTLVSCGKTQEVISGLEGTPVYSLVSGKTAAALTGYAFVGWSETQDGDVISDDELKLNADKNVYAVYRLSAYYKKVTSISAGQYLIVYETGGLAFNGGRETLDAANNTIAVEIGNNKILVTDVTTAAEFTIASVDGGYSIKSASGFYIGRTSDSNGLVSSTSEEYVNTIGISNGDADIVSSSAHLRYNSSSGQERFRYFQSTTYTNQKAIQLYKRFAQGSEESNPYTVVANGEEMVIDVATTLNNLTVEAGGTVSGSSALTVNNLTIKTKLGNVSGDDNTGGKSGEVLNPGSITASEVWIEIELTQDAAASAGWYAFSVPFPVDAMNGVYYGSTKLVNEKGYAIMSHHGDLRAENKYAWKKYRDILQPGVFYVITVGNTDYKTLRFKKVDGAAIFNANGVISGDDNDEMATQQYTSDVQGVTNADFNWNGLGNPYLETTQVDCGIMLFYDHGGNVFRQRQGTNVQLMVGSAFFYQADGSNITFSNDKDGSIALVPARTPKAIEETIFEVRLNDENGREADNLFLTAREDATNEYEIGRDVAKMSMGTAKCAQMWVPAYGTQLGAADFQLVNGKAEYPLVINTPKAGTYTMSTVANENADIYLTYEGSIIWNLSMGAYEIDLNKGTTNGYGLLLQAKAPQVVTGVDEVTGDGLQVTGVQKVIIDEHVFILRGGQMYDVTGKMVK